MILRLDRAVIDLGRDRERMSEQDARRQHATVARILERFFGPSDTRLEVQLLADEVGLGKTFVALATAYAILSVFRQREGEEQLPELKGCYRAVLVVTPAGNHALLEKWHREIEALRTRCSRDPSATRWFQARVCASPEELVESLRRAHDLRRDPEKAPCILVCQANIFTRRLRDAGERLQFIAASLFRWWRNKLTYEERYQIIRRAAEVRGFSHWAEGARRMGQGEYEVELWNFREQEEYLAEPEQLHERWDARSQRRYDQTPFTYHEIAEALDRLAQTDNGQDLLYDERRRTRDGLEEPRGLLPYCKWAADRRGHAEWYFQGFKDRLADLYRELCLLLMRRDLPLVIADEAHHWRHSQRQDCQAFRRFIAPCARRLLLLTATPFQLRWDEILEVLATTDHMERAIGMDRIQVLRSRRDRLADTMWVSEEAGRSFSREWGALADQFARLDANLQVVVSQLPGTDDPRTQKIARHWERLRTLSGAERDAALQRVPGPLRPFFARAVHLRDANQQLQAAMAPLIIRHRRQTEHRRYWIGREYPRRSEDAQLRPDQSQLHLAPGRSMPPDAELAQYLLMKVVAEISHGRHRTALGMDLTGCYTTLWQSKEGGRAVATALQAGPDELLRILQRVTGHGQEDNPRDAEHPKVRTVVDEVLRQWDQGEKSLIFCFRVPTAETLYRLLSKGVADRLRKARRALFASRGTEIGSEEEADRAMQQFRRSLLAREGSGVPLFLDRVLLGWLMLHRCPVPEVTPEDRQQLASLCGRALYNHRPLFTDVRRPDRVFLHRAVEHVLACKMLRDSNGLAPLPAGQREATQHLLEQMAGEAWVCYRYGESRLSMGRGEEDKGGEDRAEYVARSSLAVVYALRPEPDPRSSGRCPLP